MSKPREIWWSYAKAMIRQYPALHEQLRSLRTQNVTASLSGMACGGGGTRTVENVALRELTPIKQKEHDAVEKAVMITQHMQGGQERLRIINLVYWKQSKNIDGAAITICCSRNTAQRYHAQFVRLVGKCYGLL